MKPPKNESSISPSAAPSSFFRRIYHQFLSALGLISTLLILCVIITVAEHLTTTEPVFLSAPNLFNIGRQTSITAIVAMGMTFVIISAGIDLSVGAVMALSGCTFAVLYSNLHFAYGPSIAIALLAACFFGLLNGLLVVVGRIQPFIATLGTMSMARGTVLLITQGRSISNFPESFYWFGGGRVFGMPVVPIFIMAIIAVITHFLLTQTKLGMMAYAIGGNEEATWLSGINTGINKTYLYIICGALAGIGGLLLASRLNSAVPTMSTGEEFNAIAAAVIGGTSLMGGEGSIIGTVIGALILSIVRNGLNLLNVSSYWQVFSIGAIVIIAVLVDQWRPGRSR